MSGEKRSNDSDEVLLAETTILLDVEGTTTSISFVKEKLFPYVRDNLKKYVDEKWDQEEFNNDFQNLKEQAKKDEEEKVTGFLPISGASPEEEKESLVKNVLWQMDADRKTEALKQFQGHIWRKAFESGEIKGHVYDDVPKALESWTNGGRKVYIYSSGSVEAQKLLFGHCQDDLTKYLSDYFDTQVGAKTEVDSYKNILNKLNVPASSVIFLTDTLKEAQAAKEAGMSATIVIRENNAPINDEDKSAFSTIKSFDELSFQILSKRQKVDSSEDKKESKVEEPAKSESVEKSESNDKSQVDSQTDAKNVSEPMDTSDDVLVEIEKKAEDVKPEESEVKVVVEAEKNERKDPEAEVSKEEVPKMTNEYPKVLTDNENVKPEDENKVNVEEKRDEEMIVDEPDNVSKPQEVGVTENIINEEVKEITTEETKSSNEENSEKCVPTPEIKTDDKTELKPEIETTSEMNETPKEVTVVEEKIENTEDIKEPVAEVKEIPVKETKETPVDTKEAPIESKEEDVAESKVEKVPEIVVEKAPEMEAEVVKTTEVKENGGVTKAEVKGEEETEAETKKAQPELRCEKAEEDKTEKNDQVPEKSKEGETVTEIEKTKDEENKQNGTSNGDGKHSNGVVETEKSESNTTEGTSSQNGEAQAAESSEAIKVKKVVDSTVADGAGEPEVVTPHVAVAATS